MSKIIISSLAIVLIFSLTIVASDTKNTDKDNIGKPSKTKTQEIQSTDNPQLSIPKMINYQGKLTDTLGNPQNDTFDMTFRIYDAAIGGTEYWYETQTDVIVTDGLFNVMLGSINSIDLETEFPFGPDCYLEIIVGTQTITPRQRIVSHAYTFFADMADEADNAANLDGVPASSYVVRPIQSEDIADEAVTMPKINQSGATTGQVIKWTDSTWTPQDDNTVGTPSGPAGGDLTGTYPNPLIANSAVTMPKLNQSGATTGQVIKWTGSTWAPSNDEGAGGPFLALAGGTMTGPITNTGNPAITMGKANFGSGNTNSGYYAFVAGINNTASGYIATVDGGNWNTASGNYASISGGQWNTASGLLANVGGGGNNTAGAQCAAVGGGYGNIATGNVPTVCGGAGNTASGWWATVGGGYNNKSAGQYSFTTNWSSEVPSSYENSAAFNGQHATASQQLRCGILSKVTGSFTIDHPIDPNNKILNHYFVESPDMSNIYSGSAVLDASGRAEVSLPDYFDALNQNPRIQLTGVDSPEVYVAEDIQGNRFVIGGKPGCKVYWQVTGDRKDPSAQATRYMMPVEQPKTGALAGSMLDDDFLVGCMKQLEEMGKAGEFSFRTAKARQRYEDMKRLPSEIEKMQREPKPVKD